MFSFAFVAYFVNLHKAVSIHKQLVFNNEHFTFYPRVVQIRARGRCDIVTFEYVETWTDMDRCSSPREVTTVHLDCSGFDHKGLRSRGKVSTDATAEKL